MRVPLSWLADYVDIDVDAIELARRLTVLGMEVRDVERWGGDWQEVVVGELLAVERHPQADRLSLTRVRVGDGEPLSIVCGATNIAVGQRVPVALSGAILPGGRRIERAEKAGVVSNGMLCSGDELRLTGDGDGILILPADTPVGVPLVDLYGDWVLDVDVKPNRGDALSMVGIAREVAATTGGSVRFPGTRLIEDGDPIGDRLQVTVEEPALCSRFVGRHVAGVRVGPAPDRVQMRLLAAGVRPISNVVDASNYVMLELGKPIHAFDAAAVHEGRLIVRRARAGERLETLDHVERELDPETLLIADQAGPLAIAGIMGGASSEVSDGTVDVIVESAIFDPILIRRTGHRYGLRSEASLRFEKGIEWRLAALGADRTAQLIVEWAGGRIARGSTDSAPDEPLARRVAYRPVRVDRLLGTDLTARDQADILARVGIDAEPAPAGAMIEVAHDPQPLRVEADDEAWLAIVPSWRHDLRIEADVAEEIARLAGYETIPAVRPHTAMPSFRPSPTQLRDRVREVLVGAGLTEVVGHALTSPGRDAAFPPATGIPDVPTEEGRGGDAIVLANPLSRDRSVLRRSLVGSLLEIADQNLRAGHRDLAFFEIGKGYARSGDTIGEWWRLGLALTGDMVAAHWTGPARQADLHDAIGLVELIATALSLARPISEPARDDPLYHPGRSATIVADDTTGRPGLAGRIGELHPSVLEAWSSHADRVIVAELAIAGLSGGQLPRIASRFQSRSGRIERDIAIIVAEEVPVGNALRVAERMSDALESVSLFDVYRGAPLGPREKSLAIRLALETGGRSPEEIDRIVDAVRRELERELGGRART